MSGQKTELRREYKARGNTLSAEYRQAADRAVCEAVQTCERWRRAGSVFVFVSMWAEPDTGALLDAAFREGKRVYVPLCCPDGMKAVRIRSCAELRPGTYGIPEPTSDAEAAGPGDIDLALVPCVSVTCAGERLGHGAGYYDRFLRLHKCATLCLCYARMMAEALPTEEHDVRMDAVVTEDGILTIKEETADS